MTDKIARELIEALRDIALTTFDQNARDKALAALAKVGVAIRSLS
jgi:hypothetical protein